MGDKTDSLIRATEFTEVKLTAYENYLTEQLPVLWQPNFVSSITEIHKGFKGSRPRTRRAPSHRRTGTGPHRTRCTGERERTRFR